MLELTRLRHLQVIQSEDFGEIEVELAPRRPLQPKQLKNRRWRRLRARRPTRPSLPAHKTRPKNRPKMKPRCNWRFIGVESGPQSALSRALATGQC